MASVAVNVWRMLSHAETNCYEYFNPSLACTYLPRPKDEKLLENYVRRINELNEAGYESNCNIPHDASAAPSKFKLTLAGLGQGAKAHAAEGVENQFKVGRGHSFRA